MEKEGKGEDISTWAGQVRRPPYLHNTIIIMMRQGVCTIRRRKPFRPATQVVPPPPPGFQTSALSNV